MLLVLYAYFPICFVSIKCIYVGLVMMTNALYILFILFAGLPVLIIIAWAVVRSHFGDEGDNKHEG